MLHETAACTAKISLSKQSCEVFHTIDACARDVVLLTTEKKWLFLMILKKSKFVPGGIN